MRIPVVAGWTLLGIFAVLAVPSVYRLVRAVPGHAGPAGRVAGLGAVVGRADLAVRVGRADLAVRAGRADFAVGAGREDDLAELVMLLAMAAMVSPLGGPIPAAGWEAVLILAAGYFLVAAVRGRRCFAVHHTIAATVMLYMITAMPAHTDHGPWFTMLSSARPALPALAALAAAYFSYDAVRVGGRAIRNARAVGIRDVTFARPICRAVMGAGMAYLLVASTV